MGAKLVKFELNREGVRELMKSPEMMAICTSYANDAVATLGEGHAVTNRTGKTRVNAEVAAITYKARKDNLEKNTILKAIGGV